MIRIIPSICNDGCSFLNDWCKALFCMGYISLITTGDSDPDWPANAIADQMKLAV